MNEEGTLSGFLTSKFVVAFACVLLIGSTTASYLRFSESVRKRKLRHVINTLAISLREAESTPGNVHINRRLPSVGKSYTVLIRGKLHGNQMVEFRVKSIDGLRKTIFLSSEVNDGDFLIEERNPDEIDLRKSEHISMEII